MVWVREGGGSSKANDLLKREARADAIRAFESAARWPIFSIVALTLYLIITVIPFADYEKINPAVIGLIMLISTFVSALSLLLFEAVGALMFVITILWMRRVGRRTDRILDLQTDGRERLVYYWWGSKGRRWTVRSWKLKEDVAAWCKESGIKILALPVRHGEEERPRIYFRRPADAVAFKMRWY